MILTMDTRASILRITEDGRTTELPLYSAQAFEELSRQWLVLGWNLGHWSTFSWMGRQFLQLPDDVLRLGELLWNLRPDVVVETGVYDGGSTLFFATLCRMWEGRVISIERDFRPGVKEAIRQAAGDIVSFIEGDSASALVRPLIRREERVFVFLDSDHSQAHVSAELANLAELVTPGSYLVVADSNLSELAATPNGEKNWAHDGPAKAVEQFLAAHPEFSRERPKPLFGAEFDFPKLSYFPTTWLKRSVMRP
jgi:cephalosporin hydroxylase